MNRSPWWKGTRGEWYVVVQGLLFILVVLGPQDLPGQPAWSSELRLAATGLGAVFVLAGAVLAGTGLLVLGKNLSPFPHPVDDAEFVRRGPYHIVRHPIYSGIILSALGWAGIVQGTLTMLYVFMLLIFFDLKTRREERWLMQKFEGYSQYRKEVRKLIPWIY